MTQDKSRLPMETRWVEGCWQYGREGHQDHPIVDWGLYEVHSTDYGKVKMCLTCFHKYWSEPPYYRGVIIDWKRVA